MRPPAAGFSTSSVNQRPGCQPRHRLLERHHWQPAVARESAIDAAAVTAAYASDGMRARNGASSRIGLGLDALQRRRIADGRAPPAPAARRGSQPLEQRGPRVAAQVPGAAARRVDLADDLVEDRIQRAICPPLSVVSRATTRSRCAGSVCGCPRAAPRPRSPGGPVRATPTARFHSSKTSSTSASQNSIRTGRRRGPLA